VNFPNMQRYCWVITLQEKRKYLRKSQFSRRILRPSCLATSSFVWNTWRNLSAFVTEPQF
jgi:carbamate kinase